MESNIPQLWVGFFQKTGALVVYDKQLQIKGQPEVYLYSVNKNTVRPFEPDFARSKVVAARGAERDFALASYTAWRTLDNGTFVREELSRISAEKLKIEQAEVLERLKTKQAKELQRSQLIERHRKYLASVDFQYLGTNLGSKKERRITHCWRCWDRLDNSINIECASCHWILCECGACGCGRDTG